MASIPCPNCGTPHGQSLSNLLVTDKFEYFLCAKCGHLWTVAKDGSGKIEGLTPPTRVAR